MTLSSLATYLGLFGFFSLSLACAVTDAQRLKIPNSFTLLIALLYPIFVMSAPFPVDWLSGLAVGAGILTIGFLIFAGGLIGAGDVKFLAAAGLWAGLAHLSTLILVTAIAGGVLGLGYLVADRLRRIPWMPLPPPEITEEDGKKRMIFLPYGIAICAGAVTVAYRLTLEVGLAQ